jgi:hypothetical protein
MAFELERGEVYLRETVPGTILISWYPRERTMPDWPGSIIEAAQHHDFPHQAFLRGHRAVVQEWVKRQRW